MKIFLFKCMMPVFCMALLLSIKAAGQNKPYILDMVHNNPGEKLTQSSFNDPAFLKQEGYNGMVVNEFSFVHTAITFDGFDKRIFPVGSVEREWVLKTAEDIRAHIRRAHAAGLKAYYFTDIIVLPKKLVELYHDEICDANGKISFERPKTIEIHRFLFNAVFEAFPDLDGLVIRTGETYLNNVPYHTGNNPITNGVESHIKLLNLLRQEVCVKHNKMVFYRTWSFGGMHDDPSYYLAVTDKIEPHPNLVFSIKHTKGDYQRTFDFNPTLLLGKHRQIVEVECQREYEGKGAYPDYIGDGVINGFEEYKGIKPQRGYRSLQDIKGSPLLSGVWTWSRGGGWVGPYINNEFWCRLNAYVISHWIQDTRQTEEQVFDKFMDENGLIGESRNAFRQLCLLSAKAELRGHESAKVPFNSEWTWWTRDEFLAGTGSSEIKSVNQDSSEGLLNQAFDQWYTDHSLTTVIDEKYEAVELWRQITALSKKIKMNNKDDEHYILVSSQYGLLLHQIIAEGWNIMALGFIGDKTGSYDRPQIAKSIKKYDEAWEAFKKLKDENPDCATLYKPFAFVYKGPDYHGYKGMGASVDAYRKLIE